MKIKVQNFLTLTLIMTLLGTLSCSDSSQEGSTPIRKGSNGGGVIQKPDQKAAQKALEDKVLLIVDKTSSLKAADDQALAFSAVLKINNRSSNLSWQSVFKLKPDESAGPISPQEIDLGDDDLKLSLTAQRIKKSDKKDDLGFVVLKYELQREVQKVTKKSLNLVLVDLNKVKNASALRKSEVIYPVTDDFSLKDWIDKNTKQP